jgi:hypothetical protein
MPVIALYEIAHHRLAHLRSCVGHMRVCPAQLDGLTNRRRIPADGVTTDAYEAFAAAAPGHDDDDDESVWGPSAATTCSPPESWRSSTCSTARGSREQYPTQLRTHSPARPAHAHGRSAHAPRSGAGACADLSRGAEASTACKVARELHGALAPAVLTILRIAAAAKGARHAKARASPDAGARSQAHALSTEGLAALRAERNGRRIVAQLHARMSSAPATA